MACHDRVLANLYARGDEWDEIVELTAGVSNQDDITLLLCLQQAQALTEQGMPDAALAVYRDALSKRSRSKELLARARYGRAKLYLETGKRSMPSATSGVSTRMIRATATSVSCCASREPDETPDRPLAPLVRP